MLSFDKQGLAIKPLIKKNKSPKGRRQSAIAHTIQVKVHMKILENLSHSYSICKLLLLLLLLHECSCKNEGENHFRACERHALFHAGCPVCVSLHRQIKPVPKGS